MNVSLHICLSFVLVLVVNANYVLSYEYQEEDDKDTAVMLNGEILGILEFLKHLNKGESVRYTDTKRQNPIFNPPGWRVRRNANSEKENDIKTLRKRREILMPNAGEQSKTISSSSALTKTEERRKRNPKTESEILARIIYLYEVLIEIEKEESTIQPSFKPLLKEDKTMPASAKDLPSVRIKRAPMTERHIFSRLIYLYELLVEIEKKEKIENQNENEDDYQRPYNDEDDLRRSKRSAKRTSSVHVTSADTRNLDLITKRKRSIHYYFKEHPTSKAEIQQEIRYLLAILQKMEPERRKREKGSEERLTKEEIVKEIRYWLRVLEQMEVGNYE